MPGGQESAELGTSTPVPAQPLIYCVAFGNLPSYSFSVCFCVAPWMPEDSHGVLEGADKKLATET